MPQQSRKAKSSNNNASKPRRRNNRRMVVRKVPKQPVPQMRKGNLPIRNVATITDSLANQMGSLALKQSLPAYVSCRLNPFTGPGGLGIPDGNNRSFIRTDVVSNDTISSIANGSFVIQTLPCLPATAMIASLGLMNVNGVSMSPVTAYQPYSTLNTSAWVPLGVSASFSAYGTYAPGLIATDPYSATKCRIAAIGYRLIYTGPASTCAGSIVVTPNPIGLSVSAQSTSAVIPAIGNNYAYATVDNALGSAVCTGVGTTMLALDTNVSSTIMTRGSHTFRPEEGLIIVPRHMSGIYETKPIAECPYAMLGDFSTGATLPHTWYNVLRRTSTYSGGILFYDDSWETFQISASGLNPDASYRLETIFCLELNPAMNSSITPLATRVSQSNPEHMKLAERLLEKYPAVSSLNGRHR